jgi:hypothetical protein
MREQSVRRLVSCARFQRQRRRFLTSVNRQTIGLRLTARLLVLFAAVALPTLDSDVAGASSQSRVDFDREIRPILSDACFTCHGPDSNKRATDLRFDVEASVFSQRDEPIIVRGNSAASALIQRIVAADADVRMPPAEAARQLTDQEVELLKRWIDEGAEYASHWAFEKLRRPEFPSVSDPAWPRNGVDPFVLSRLDSLSLKPSPPASRETLIRRACHRRRTRSTRFWRTSRMGLTRTLSTGCSRRNGLVSTLPYRGSTPHGTRTRTAISRIAHGLSGPGATGLSEH